MINKKQLLKERLDSIFKNYTTEIPFSEVCDHFIHVIKTLRATFSEVKESISDIFNEISQRIQILANQDYLSEDEFISTLSKLKVEHKFYLRLLEKLMDKENDFYFNNDPEYVDTDEVNYEVGYQTPRSNSSEEIWKHRCTKPDPFKFTILQEVKQQKIEFENPKLDAEPSKSKVFRALPVPAHVYLPLYKKITEESSQRRNELIHARKELLKSIERPFSFYYRDKNKDRKERHALREQQISDKMKEFRNKASILSPRSRIPNHIYERKMERFEEDELLREVCRRLRAQKLLRSAALPPGMELREAERKERLKLRARSQSASRILKKQVPRRSSSEKRTNFASLHAEQRWQLAKAKDVSKLDSYTRTIPFDFKTDRRSQIKDHRTKSDNKNVKLQHQIKKDSSKINSTLRAQTAFVPIQMARASEIRNTFIKEKYLKADETGLELRDGAIKPPIRGIRYYDIHRKNLGSARKPNEEVDDFVKARREEMQTELRKRERAYKDYLAEMHERVGDRPSLTDQHLRKMKIQDAQKRIESLLKKSGIEYHEDPLGSRLKIGSIYSKQNCFGDLSD